MKPTLAVLITYYNEGDLLRACLESLVYQTGRPDEIIVYDDASKISPDAFIDPKWGVKVIHGKTNRGPSFGRNQLLAAATADTVHFHDCDDLFMPEWCAKVRAGFDHPEVKIVVTELDSEKFGKPYAKNIIMLQLLPELGNDLLKFAIRHAILPSATTVDRKLALTIDGYDSKIWYSEDYFFHARLAAERIRFRVIEEALVKKVIREESRSEKIVETWMGVVYSVLLLTEIVPPEYFSDLAEKASRAAQVLFHEGAKEAAEEALVLVRNLGGANLDNRPKLFRWVARHLGQSRAETLASYYRKRIPERIRRVSTPLKK